MPARLWIILLVAAAPTMVPAQSNETDAIDVHFVEDCTERMGKLLDRLQELEAAATNEVTRADCILDKANKIRGLLELTRTAAARLPALIADDDTESLAAEQSAIAIACARSQKLAVEAEACRAVQVNRPRKRRVTPDSSPAPAQPLTRPGAVQRDEETCIKQAQLARLLIQAMELAPDPQKPTRSPTEELARFAIEPMRGWKPDDCTSLDDLCVAVARALNLKVESPTEPASYCQALRDEGLGLDTSFPRRVEGVDAPLLLESEVRTFFAKGYAVPLASSRRLGSD